MENATNALTIAGSILIGIIVISLFVYLFSTMGSTAKKFQEDMDSISVQKFNEPFEKYDGKNDLTPHDILTLNNLVNEIKQKYDIEDIITITGITKAELKDPELYLSSDNTYTCNLTYSKETSKVVAIILKKNFEKNNGNL